MVTPVILTQSPQQHVSIKWVQKCVKHRVHGRNPVGRKPQSAPQDETQKETSCVFHVFNGDCTVLA